MDSRFLEPGFSQAMPLDWFESDFAEIVSDRILSKIAAFWTRSPCSFSPSLFQGPFRISSDNSCRTGLVCSFPQMPPLRHPDLSR